MLVLKNHGIIEEKCNKCTNIRYKSAVLKINCFEDKSSRTILVEEKNIIKMTPETLLNLILFIKITEIKSKEK